MEQKSFYSGIKVQSLSKSVTTIPALRWNRRNRWNTLSAQPIPKSCHIPFTIPVFHLFLFPKIIKRNTVNCNLIFIHGGHSNREKSMIFGQLAGVAMLLAKFYAGTKR